MSLNELDFSGVEQALEEGYKLIVSPNLDYGVIADIYGEHALTVASGVSNSEENMDEYLKKLQRSVKKDKIGHMSIPEALAKAAADYSGEEFTQPVERTDGLTKFLTDEFTSPFLMRAEYRENHFILETGYNDIKARGNNLEDAYENLQTKVLAEARKDF